jgi:ubiquinone/menaquinone biosynthesis C-methylase UbiE
MSQYGGYKDNHILAELYDLVPAYVNRPDRNLYLQYCRTAGGRILEIGCGTGRVLIPAAESNCLITGLDASENMLARCRQKIQSKNKEVQKRVRLVLGSMTDFDLDDSFHLTIMPFRVFQHLISADEQLSSLRQINRHLVMTGRLVYDVFQVNLSIISNPRLNEEVEDFAEIEISGGGRLRRTHRIVSAHRTEQYQDVEMIYYLTDSEGTTERIVQSFPFRYFFRYEMEHLLARSGFRIIDLFGDFDRSPLSDNSPEMVFVAEKCEELD